jgi:two-component system phosphate regulon sensor histidine kinase PhoR
MTTRFLALVLAGIVLPTIALSLLAARSLGDWSGTMRRRLEQQAGSSLQSIRERVQSQVEDERLRLLDSMTEALRKGGVGDIQEAAARAVRTQPLVKDVYVFMNPWGFIYPPTGAVKKVDFPLAPPVSAGAGKAEHATEWRGYKEEGRSESVVAPAVSAGSGSDRGTKPGDQPSDATSDRGGDWTTDELVLALRKSIAESHSANDTFFIRSGDQAYVFSPAGRGRGLFVGYAIRSEGLASCLDRLIHDAGDAGIAVRMQDTSIAAGKPSGSGVLVSDSLTPPNESVTAAEKEPADPRVLAEVRLLPPLSVVRLTAYPLNPDELETAGRLRARLYGWTIAVLACVVLAASAVSVRNALTEARKVRVQRDVMINVSHDLRTPVSSIRAMGESLLLGQFDDPVRTRRFHELIVTESERLGLLVEKALYLLRFEQNAIAFTWQEMDANDVVAAVVGAYRVREAGGKPAPRLSVVTDTRSPIPVHGDRTAILQVVMNLVDNAAKHAYPDGTQPDPAGQVIEVDVKTCDCAGWSGNRKWVTLAVRDHGCGVPRSEQRNIFRKFYRTAAAAKRDVSGLGLGLAMCRYVVKEHGGRIVLNSVPGKGSEFVVWLPAAG